MIEFTILLEITLARIIRYFKHSKIVIEITIVRPILERYPVSIIYLI
jgi:hypothetical protein